MSTAPRQPHLEQEPEEATVLDLFKAIFKDWRSLVTFATTLFDEARRDQFNRSFTAVPVAHEAVVPRHAVPVRPGSLPWRSLAGTVIALLAQFLLEPAGTLVQFGELQVERAGRNPPLALGFYLLAGVLILWGIIRQEWQLPLALPDRKGGDPARLRLIALVVALVFSFVAFLAFLGNTFTAFNLSAWLLAILAFVYALWIPYRRELREPDGSSRRQRWLWMLVLVLAVALVAFFRVYRIADVPSEPFSDHAEKILDVYDITQGQTSIFFPRNTGREAFQMYWTLLVSWVFGTGLSFLSLKIGTVMLGLLTLPYVYLLGSEVGGKRAGLFALVFTGIGYWPNVISRVGLRFPLYPLFVAPVLFYLVRGLRTRNRNDFLLSGLFLGLGLHGYSPIRIVPFLVLMAIGLYLLHAQSRGARRDAVLWLAVLGSSALIVFLPLLRYALENPELFSYRAFSRLGGIEQPLPAPPVQIFVSNLWNALRMFNWDDGEIWVHSVTHRPALDVVAGAFFLIGVLLLAYRYLRDRHWLDLFLLLSVPLLQMPSILSLAYPGENPALNRAGGAYVPVFLIVALAMDGLMASLDSGKWRARIAWGVAVCLVAFSAVQNYDLVFRQYAGQFEGGAWNTSALGAVIEEFEATYGTTETIWIVPFPHWVDTRLPGVWAGVPNRDFALWRENLDQTLAIQGPKAFLVKAHVSEPADNDQETLDALMELYPNGSLELRTSEVKGHEFWVFSVPAQ